MPARLTRRRRPCITSPGDGTAPISATLFIAGVVGMAMTAVCWQKSLTDRWCKLEGAVFQSISRWRFSPARSIPLIRQPKATVMILVALYFPLNIRIRSLPRCNRPPWRTSRLRRMETGKRITGISLSGNLFLKPAGDCRRGDGRLCSPVMVMTPPNRKAPRDGTVLCCCLPLSPVLAIYYRRRGTSAGADRELMKIQTIWKTPH
ncbi:hypothetical protein KCP73_07300 [Salmonella enterica subsp. enterica]|nr:hypothetical protein KCP73_07300 [Salmonella enterica subsp. enterica]